MEERLHGADSHRISRLAAKMRNNRDYRASYVASYTRQFLSRQMREFRGDMSQSDFGARIGKQQTIVSRLEDPNYGKWTLQTLLDVADKLDVAVLVRFVDFTTFIRQTNDRSQGVISPKPYSSEEIDGLADTVREDHSMKAFYDSTERMLKTSNEKSAKIAPLTEPVQSQISATLLIAS